MSIAARRLMRSRPNDVTPPDLVTTAAVFPNLTTHPNALWTRSGNWLSSPSRWNLPVFDITDGFVFGETEPTWTNSGCRIPQAQLTTNNTTNFVTSADGQEISGLYLPQGRIEVRHKNVYIHDCIINIGPNGGGGRQYIQNNVGIVHSPSYDTSGNVIAHVTIDPVNAWDASTASISGARDAYGDAQTSGIFLYGGTTGAAVYRCAIRRVTDGIMPDTRSGMTAPVHMWGNYIETRWLAYDKEQTDGAHNDCIQIAGSDGTSIVGNTLKNPSGGILDPNGSGMQIKGQCIVLTPYHQPQISNTYIYKNWLSGAYTQISAWSSWAGSTISLGGPAMPGLRIIDNRHGGQCVWPVLLTPTQDKVTIRSNNIADSNGLRWNSQTSGSYSTTAAGAAAYVNVAANTGGGGITW